jgi:uncharacterized protein YozE (UPF0346 family)
MLAPAYQALGIRAQTLTPSLVKIGEVTSAMSAFDGLTDSYDESFSRACEEWLSSEPDAEAKYEQSVAAFRQAYEQYRQHRRGQESELAGLVESLASQVSSASPAAAEKLRQTSEKLRRQGIGVFRAR